MKKIILLFLLLICIPTVLANIDCQGCYDLYTEFTDTPVSQEIFTQTIQDQTMSSTVTKLTGKDLTVNIYVDTTKIGAHLQDGKITTLQDGPLQDPKLEVRTSRLALKHILQAEDQKQALTQMFKEGHITYKAHTWRMKIKLWAAKKFAAKKYNITGLSVLRTLKNAEIKEVAKNQKEKKFERFKHFPEEKKKSLVPKGTIEKASFPECQRMYYSQGYGSTNDFEYANSIDGDEISQELIETLETFGLLNQNTLNNLIEEIFDSPLIESIQISDIDIEDDNPAWETNWYTTLRTDEWQRLRDLNTITYENTNPIDLEVDLTLVDGRVFRAFLTIDALKVILAQRADLSGTFNFKDQNNIIVGAGKDFYWDSEFTQTTNWEDSDGNSVSYTHPIIYLENSNLEFNGVLRVLKNGELNEVTDGLVLLAIENFEDAISGEGIRIVELGQFLTEEQTEMLRVQMQEVMAIMRARQILFEVPFYYGNKDNLNVLWIEVPGVKAFICNSERQSNLDPISLRPTRLYVENRIYYN